MAISGEHRTTQAHGDDPNRTDVLPLLGAEALEDPTVSAPWALAAGGSELTQPRLPLGGAAQPSVEAELVQLREALQVERKRSAELAAALEAAALPVATHVDAALLAEREASLQALEASQQRLVAELEAVRQLVPAQDLAAELQPLRAELAQLRTAAADHDAERAGWREARDAAFADVQRLSTRLAGAETQLVALRDQLACAEAALAAARAASALRAAPAEPSPEPPVPLLIPLTGAPAGAFRLGVRTRVGRADDNELKVDAPSISRHHAILINSVRGVFIEDLNSVNGVYLNRKRIRQARLADGDVITLGSVSFRYSGPRNPAA